MHAEMPSSFILEVMNSINPALSWNRVTKGRRSKNPAARRLSYVSKAGNCSSPKRVQDFSGSDSDKFGEVGVVQSTSGKSENVPIKKRRHLLQSPSLHQDYAYRKLTYPSCSSDLRPSNWQLEGFDSKNDGFDFSGIELLAAAASMDDNVDNDANANKDSVVERGVSLMEERSEEQTFATHSEQGLESNRSENTLSNTTVNGGNVDYSRVMMYDTDGHSLSRSPGDGTWRKVKRKHWDLNTSMDDWDEQYDDSIAGSISRDVNCGLHVEERLASVDCVPPLIPCGDIDESNLEVEEYNKSASGSLDRTCGELHSLIEHLREPPEICTDERKPVHEEASDQVQNTDVTGVNSPFIQLSWSSGRSMPEEKINTTSDIDVIAQDENCSSNFVVENVRTASFDRIEANNKGTVADNIPSNTVSEAATDFLCKEKRGSWECCEVPGTMTHHTQLVLVSDSMVQNGGDDDETLPGSTTAGCQEYAQQSELSTKYEYNSLPTERSKGIRMEHSWKSSTAGAECEVPVSSVGKLGCTVDTQHDLEVSQDIHFREVDEDGLTSFQLAYDSPYEDGELRGSFSYSWEDNELENECVDYESDGRNDDGSTAADCPGSGILVDCSDGIHRRSSPVQILPECNGSKSGPYKHSLGSLFVKDDSDNNEMNGKASYAGSGTTDDHSLEMISEKNDTAAKRRQRADRRGIFDVKMSHRDEYTSKTTGRKLQSHIEGRLLDGKDVFYVQHSRGHRVGVSYSRPGRDMSPEKHLGRYRPTHGERDGVYQWTSCRSRRRYTNNYQGTEGRNQATLRNGTGYLDKIGGLDVHDPREMAHFSKSFCRPLAKSLAERDEHFSVRKRMPVTRGRRHYRSRGHYLQCRGGDFVDGFEHPRDDDGAPVVRLSRYNISRRERSFSPYSSRPTHMPIHHRRSRSRSRSHSPMAWHPHRGQFLSIRRHSRSPDFRTEARLERVRLPFSKPTFASDYEEVYTSPSRGRFSSLHNCRWVDGRTTEDDHLRRKRSPVRMPRCGQRLDAIRPGGGLKSNQYFRPMVHPGRFSFRPDGDRKCKFGSGYDGRSHDDYGDEMIHPQRHSNDGGNTRRFRRKAVDNDLETSNTNK